MSTKRDGRKGRGGFTVLELLVALTIVGLLLAILIPAVQSSREAARRTGCFNHLRQYGVALHAFEATHRRFPGGVYIRSVHAEILAELDMAPVKAELDQWGFSPGVSQKMWEGTAAYAKGNYPILHCPSEGETRGTNYRYCVGIGPGVDPTAATAGAFGAVDAGLGNTVANFEDGLSQTVLMSEGRISSGFDSAYDSRIHYWYSGLIPRYDFDTAAQMFPDICPLGTAGGVPYDPSVGWEWYLASYGRTLYNHMRGPNPRSADCEGNGPNVSASTFGIHSARSLHPGGVNVLYGDGAARFASDAVDLAVWRAASTLKGRDIPGSL